MDLGAIFCKYPNKKCANLQRHNHILASCYLDSHWILSIIFCQLQVVEFAPPNTITKNLPSQVPKKFNMMDKKLQCKQE